MSHLNGAAWSTRHGRTEKAPLGSEVDARISPRMHEETGVFSAADKAEKRKNGRR